MRYDKFNEFIEGGFMSVKINTEVVEMMLYFWQAGSEGEKVGEKFIIDVANRE